MRPASIFYTLLPRNFIHASSRQYCTVYIKPSYKACLCLAPFTRPKTTTTRGDDLAININEHTEALQLKIPLPTKGNTIFSVFPGMRVKSLIRDVKAEDPCVSTVRFYDHTGNGIAASTFLNDLGSSKVNIEVNDRLYTANFPDTSAPTSEHTHINSVVERLSDIMQDKLVCDTSNRTVSGDASLTSLQDKEEERQRNSAEILRIQEELRPMEDLRKECEIRSAQHARRFAWLGLTFLGVQFGFLARLTWWEYSWDLMEPVTYFVTIGTELVLFSYFVITQTAFSPIQFRQRAEIKNFYRLAKRRGMEVSHYNQLKERLKILREKQ
eukprot:gene8130-778_t